MAFFGDLGKIFNIETREAAQIGTAFATGGIGAGLGATLGAVVSPIPEGESRPADVSARPAGVDSPQTVAPVSQTGQVDTTFRIPPAGQGFGMPQQAFIGGLLPGIATQGIGAATRLLSRPGVGGLVGGVGAGAVANFFIDEFGNQKKLVITRKLQRETKKLFMMTGGNIDIVSQQSNFFLGKRLSPDQILAILFKTFKNNGPYVTKAAVRKTQQTIRKLDTLTMLKDQMCPPKRAPARRRSTMGSTTKVLQVK
jgi:hypothetical protein